jgi:hypothetical protein
VTDPQHTLRGHKQHEPVIIRRDNPSLMFRINGVDVAKAGPAPWRTVERLRAAPGSRD